MEKYFSFGNRGQVLVVILLVIVVALTIGLSVAGSSLKSIQQTAVVEDANRAFSAAEAGIEQALLQLEQTGSVTAVSNQSLPGGSTIKQVESTTTDELQISNLEQDTVAQLDLECNTCGTGDVTVYWESGAALVITKIKKVGADYQVERWALNCNFDPGNNFSPATYNVSTGRCEFVVNVDGAVDIALRIRPLYQDSLISVVPGSTTDIPIQSTIVTSVGQSGQAERTVQVQRSLPVPPAILDYVLFSASGSLSK